MATTITIKPATRRKLELLKEKKKAATFDELLGNWTDKELKIPKSLAGRFKFMDSEDARDHIDRF